MAIRDPTISCQIFLHFLPQRKLAAATSYCRRRRNGVKHSGVNQLFFGDNLNVIRDHLATESVDPIHLAPPFNSKRDYNLLFKSPKVGRVTPVRAGLGQADDGAPGVTRPTDHSEAQITAFEDSWHWGEQAEREFDELVHAPNTDVSGMMPALRRFLGENNLMAYLTLLANRLLQLHRVLKPTGSSDDLAFKINLRLYKV